MKKTTLYSPVANPNNKDITRRLKISSLSIIKEMMYKAHVEERKGKNIVSLGVGIPYYKMPQAMRIALSKTLFEKEDIDKYTFFPGLPKLRKLIAKESSRQLNMPVSENQILVTAGSMAALLYSILTLIQKGDEVMLLSPYFCSYEQQINLAEGKIVEVPLIEPKNKNESYHLNLELIEKSITKKTKAIIINSPNNPTGSIFSKVELLKLAEIIHKKNIYLITDEVYDFLIFDEQKYFNIASVKKLWPKVIRCCSFSKRFGMTGWRIGYLQTNEELLMHIFKIHDNTIVCAPHISQEAAFLGLAMGSNLKEMKHHLLTLQSNRDLICKRLDRLPDLFSYIKPRGAYYIFPRYHLPLASSEFAHKLLYEAGVIVVPGTGFGASAENHLRLSFGTTAKEINTAFDRIENWWIKYNL